ncbi:hypothetical protein F2Q70_00012172 [Brassica cretica]|uniref:Uncharacterized protein n=1 Tax=Brassica cretica TaxID=69181 RepID=A0A8S9LTC2_BRACR|nr:hypothetical protein F2Q70_00012172 [Brassica cretica]
MFWKLTALSAASPERQHTLLIHPSIFCLGLTKQVESILDKEDFTLEELLDEEDIIQECRALNSRLINL